MDFPSHSRMSYPDSPAPTHTPPAQSFPGGNGGNFWPEFPSNKHIFDSQFQFDHPLPSFERPRNLDEQNPNFAPAPVPVPVPVPAPAKTQRTNPSNFPMNRGTTHIFYKTRMCLKFLEGNCRNGDNCTFAHGPDDLRQPPPNWQELVKDRGGYNWNDDQKIIQRMKICRKFYNGEECPYGQNCSFLHESPAKFRDNLAMEVGMSKTRESSAIRIGTMEANMENWSRNDQTQFDNKHVNSGSDALQVTIKSDSDMSASTDGFRNNSKPMHWKTKMCSKWEVTGQCPFGEKCHFAHGPSDLQVAAGNMEAEIVMNAGPIAPKPVENFLVRDATPAAVGAAEGGKEDKSSSSKWKLNRKINRIYADWIDDLALPKEMETESHRPHFV